MAKAAIFGIWLVIFIALYWVFLVFFQYGPSKFIVGSFRQWTEVKNLLGNGDGSAPRVLTTTPGPPAERENKKEKAVDSTTGESTADARQANLQTTAHGLEGSVFKEMKGNPQKADEAKIESPQVTDKIPEIVGTQIVTRDKIDAYDLKDPKRIIGAFEANTELAVVEKTNGMYRVNWKNPKNTTTIAAFCKAEAIDPSPPSRGSPWGNSLGMKFVPVSGTEVLFSIWDTRVRDYEAFVKATGKEWPKPSFEQGPTHPAVNVTWKDAKDFCKWLTEKDRKEGWLLRGQEYRLPTDAEWSIAVGLVGEVGTSPLEKNFKIAGFPWGSDWPPPKGAGNYAPSMEVDDFAKTSPAGSFNANKFGLYDMGGNVWQWCEDLFQPDMKYNKTRVLRGASWDDGCPATLTSSCRGSSDPDSSRFFDRDYIIGFRCVVVFDGH